MLAGWTVPKMHRRTSSSVCHAPYTNQCVLEMRIYCIFYRSQRELCALENGLPLPCSRVRDLPARLFGYVLRPRTILNGQTSLQSGGSETLSTEAARECHDAGRPYRIRFRRDVGSLYYAIRLCPSLYARVQNREEPKRSSSRTAAGRRLGHIVDCSRIES